MQCNLKKVQVSVTIQEFLMSFLTRSRLRKRAAGMLEYALMVLVVIAIFGVLWAFFPGFFQGLLDQFNDLISGTTG